MTSPSCKIDWEKVTPLVYPATKTLDHFKEFERKYHRNVRGSAMTTSDVESVANPLVKKTTTIR